MSTRIHIVVSDELLAAVDAARGPGQPRADFIRRAVGAETARLLPASGPGERVEGGRAFVSPAVEQALGSSGRAGVRGRVPASAPAEQPQNVEKVDVVLRDAAKSTEFNRGPRVRSSSVARPFRPAPKQGKK